MVHVITDQLDLIVLQKILLQLLVMYHFFEQEEIHFLKFLNLDSNQLLQLKLIELHLQFLHG